MIGIDGVRLQPSFPCLNHQDSCFSLLHHARPILGPSRALVVALVFVRGAKREAIMSPRLSLRPRLCWPLPLSLQVKQAMQSPKWLVGCIKVSGRRRADPSEVESDSYNLSVYEKKREVYYWASPQCCRASRLMRSAVLRKEPPRAAAQEDPPNHPLIPFKTSMHLPPNNSPGTGRLGAVRIEAAVGLCCFP
jgi:hypothetical protein